MQIGISRKNHSSALDVNINIVCIVDVKAEFLLKTFDCGSLSFNKKLNTEFLLPFSK
jgi:hypothetical protein